MVAMLVIFLREGVEASMIVAILLAYLNRTGNREYFRDIFSGSVRRCCSRAPAVSSPTRPSVLRRVPHANDLRDRHLPARRRRPDLHDLLDAQPRARPVG